VGKLLVNIYQKEKRRIYQTWKISRAGAINYWCFDDQEFIVSDGKILFRGANGSGKSITLQSFVPLLLDGNKSPERIDPLGTKSRKLENYILGDEGKQEDERTSYLYLEFQYGYSEKYLTIGIGFKATKGKQLQSWGFSINNGLRVNKDIFLYRNIGVKIPLTKKELEENIGINGRVVGGTNDYTKMVNDLLFGFKDIEDYKDLLNLLIQIRKPKDPKEFKPQDLSNTLKESLRPLNEEDLNPVAEAIENIDELKNKLEELENSQKSAKQVKLVYDVYNKLLLITKADKYKEVKTAHENLLIQTSALNENLKENENQAEQIETEINDLILKEEYYKEKAKHFEKHQEIKDLVNCMKELEKELEENTKKESQLFEETQEKENDISKIKSKNLENKDKINKTILEIKKSLKEMDYLQEKMQFDEHEFFKDEILKNITTRYSYNYTKNKITNYMKLLTDCIGCLQREHEKNKVVDYAVENMDLSKSKVEKKKLQLEEAYSKLDDAKETFLNSIYEWSNKNSELKFQEQNMEKVANKVRNYENDSNFSSIFAIAQNKYNENVNIIHKDKIDILANKIIEENTLIQMRDRYEQILNQSDIEIENSEAVLNNRNRLKQKGIPFIPLYKVINFKSDVTEQKRNNIEGALYEMGLLNALIIPNRYIETALQMDNEDQDKYLIGNTRSKHNRSFLDLVDIELAGAEGISKEEVSCILSKISIESDGDIYVDNEGVFGFSILKGKVTCNYKAKYVGRKTREEYKCKILDEINSNLRDLQRKVEELSLNLANVNTRLNVVEKELGLFPDNQVIVESLEKVKNVEIEYEYAEKELIEKERNLIKLKEELHQIKKQVEENTKCLRINRNLQAYKDAFEALTDYNNIFLELCIKHSNLVNSSELLDIHRAEVEDIKKYISKLENSSNELRIINNKLSTRIKSINETINSGENVNIINEYEECIRQLEDIKELIIEKKSKRGEVKVYNDIYIKDLKEKTEQLKVKSKILLINKKGLEDEVNLGYLYKYDSSISTDAYVEKIEKEINVDRLKTKEKCSAELFDKLRENEMNLREYSIKLVFTSENSENNNEEETTEILESRQFQGRYNFECKVRGSKVGFYELIEIIDQDIKLNKSLIQEKDRELFQDILIKSLSQKIRALIFNSYQWAKDVNRLMQTMNTSSGLKISLKWQEKKAENEEQLDTAELIELLKMDDSLLKEEDLNKLTNHFKGKIYQAQIELEEKGEIKSLKSIIKEVLDYREWFEFKLYITKGQQSKKELSNKTFFQLSVGERSVAIHIPLFAALNSKYQSAKIECPRIIALDDAFLGVDDNNIKDLFRVLGELKLDYFLNSYALYGDYNTVDSLSIYDFSKSPDEDFVTLVRYHWNGERVVLVTDDEAV
jgi:uncharacterized protein (TIGR02680 family)